MLIRSLRKGAGASGLVCTKSLLDEGFEVTVFEQEPHLGGLWRYSDNTDGAFRSHFSV